MKNLIGIAVIAGLMFSCNGVTTTTTDNQQKAAMQAELTQAQHEAEILKLKSELDVHRAKQSAIDSMQSLAIGANAYRSASAGDSRTTQQTDDSWTPRQSSSTDAYRTTPSTQTTPVAVKKKKGMSTPVKGALIGAGVGAATGAIVSKKKVKGAVVGAVVGAGAGAATGVIIDKRREKKANAPYYALSSF
jgi:uncharacterized protein YfiM (DUF2279 family)